MAVEWAMRLTPEPFRDFLPYTSLSALKVIHTGKVLSRALEIVQHHAFLGVALVGLYLTLEQLQVPLDPRQAFEENFPLCGGPQAA